MSPLRRPNDEVKLRTSTKEWNKGSKDGRYGEVFFFLIEKDPCENSRGDYQHNFFRRMISRRSSDSENLGLAEI